MVPRGSILSGLEAVCEVVARRDRTLGDAIDAVHIHRLVLSNSVPMDTGAVIAHAVNNSDVDSLSSSEPETRLTPHGVQIWLTSPQHASSQGPG